MNIQASPIISTQKHTIISNIRDWGGANIDATSSSRVYAVAAQMATTQSTANPKFVLNTGDNFYW